MAAAILPVAKQRLVEAGLIGASTARMKTAARWKMVGNWRLAVDGRQPPQPTFADRLAINKSASVGGAAGWPALLACRPPHTADRRTSPQSGHRFAPPHRDRE